MQLLHAVLERVQEGDPAVQEEREGDRPKNRHVLGQKILEKMIITPLKYITIQKHLYLTVTQNLPYALSFSHDSLRLKIHIRHLHPFRVLLTHLHIDGHQKIRLRYGLIIDDLLNGRPWVACLADDNLRPDIALRYGLILPLGRRASHLLFFLYIPFIINEK